MAKNEEKVIDDLRHNEYYGTQKIYDDLYAKSKENIVFNNLMEIILSEENILLAYRNIKANGGSKTPGTDGKNIDDIARHTPTEVIEKVKYIVNGSEHGYRPKPVRRKEIPKPNGKTRPLGIPCIWDRLIQQCIKQVLEPICEAKFSDNSFGFRPNRSVEHAIARTYRMIQMSNLYHVIEFDIKGFFDNVNHSKLIKQMWALGIRDKKLISVIKKILKAPIKLENGEVIYPDKGTPQGGIISPLLANIVLNELDHWVESQWQENPIINNYSQKQMKNGTFNRGHGYRAMKTTKLKEMWIVRYADDFRIFCRKPKDATKTKIAITKWLEERLKLEISNEKTRIVDVRNQSMEFLGFKIKTKWNGKKKKYVIKSNISEKALKDKEEKLIAQAKKVCSNPGLSQELNEIMLYNNMVIGIQNYYRIATDVADDLNHIQNRTYLIMHNRLNTQTGNRLAKKGRKLTEQEYKRYGNSKSIRYIKGTNEPIYPIGYISHKNPIAFNRRICNYTNEGREYIHKELSYSLPLLYQMRKSQSKGYSIELFDNRISLYSAQRGRCYVMGSMFQEINEIHCHHKTPVKKGGKDEYNNLVLILEDVHKLIHATKEETIQKYLELIKPNKTQLKKINYLKFLLGEKIIKEYNIEKHTVILEFEENYLEI